MKLKTANLQHEKKICWVLVRRLRKVKFFTTIAHYHIAATCVPTLQQHAV